MFLFRTFFSIKHATRSDSPLLLPFYQTLRQVFFNATQPIFKTFPRLMKGELELFKLQY